MDMLYQVHHHGKGPITRAAIIFIGWHSASSLTSMMGSRIVDSPCPRKDVRTGDPQSLRRMRAVTRAHAHMDFYGQCGVTRVAWGPWCPASMSSSTTVSTWSFSKGVPCTALAWK
jgi:hypothetical protein